MNDYYSCINGTRTTNGCNNANARQLIATLVCSSIQFVHHEIVICLSARVNNLTMMCWGDERLQRVFRIKCEPHRFNEDRFDFNSPLRV